MFDNDKKNFNIAAFSAVGGCVLLFACLMAASLGTVDVVPAIGASIALSTAITVASHDADEYARRIGR